MTILLYDLIGKDLNRPFSPHGWKVAMALSHKGLEFRRVPTPFTAISAVEAGGHKTVPVMRDGGTVVSDSMEIARYLEMTYPDRPSLFGGPGGEATARFVERWTQVVVQSQMLGLIVKDIHDILGPDDQAYFRQSRELRFGKPLEEVPVGRESRLEEFRLLLEPLRSTLCYEHFIGGTSPLFADYIVFGAFQWARVVSPFKLLSDGDPIADWLERCLDLYDGQARRVKASGQ